MAIGENFIKYWSNLVFGQDEHRYALCKAHPILDLSILMFTFEFVHSITEMWCKSRYTLYTADKPQLGWNHCGPVFEYYAPCHRFAGNREEVIRLSTLTLTVKIWSNLVFGQDEHRYALCKAHPVLDLSTLMATFEFVHRIIARCTQLMSPN